MAVLTETEIFDSMITDLQGAVDSCTNLALLPMQGPTYVKLRDQLRRIEGACRQAAHWREDARWSWFGFEMARFHDRLGDCIRCRAPRKIFLAQAELIRERLAAARQMKDAATHKLGPILPKPLEGPHRDTRPVQVLGTIH